MIQVQIYSLVRANGSDITNSTAQYFKTREDLQNFLSKHVPPDEQVEIRPVNAIYVDTFETYFLTEEGCRPISIPEKEAIVLTPDKKEKAVNRLAEIKSEQEEIQRKQIEIDEEIKLIREALLNRTKNKNIS
jgi:hypothetical protein